MLDAYLGVDRDDGRQWAWLCTHRDGDAVDIHRRLGWPERTAYGVARFRCCCLPGGATARRR